MFVVRSTSATTANTNILHYIHDARSKASRLIKTSLFGVTRNSTHTQRNRRHGPLRFGWAMLLCAVCLIACSVKKKTFSSADRAPGETNEQWTFCVLLYNNNNNNNHNAMSYLFPATSARGSVRLVVHLRTLFVLLCLMIGGTLQIRPFSFRLLNAQPPNRNLFETTNIWNVNSNLRTKRSTTHQGMSTIISLEFM